MGNHRIDDLMERAAAMRTGHVRVTLKDGTETVVRVADAIPLWKDSLAVKIEPEGDMTGCGRLWELLARLCEEEANEQDR